MNTKNSPTPIYKRIARILSAQVSSPVGVVELVSLMSIKHSIV